MSKQEEEQELDQFWRDLSAEMIPDTITLEEADRRMAAADDDELSEARIENMVQCATTRRRSLKPAVESLPPAPRGRLHRFGGFRLTANVAATGAFSVLLLSSTMLVMLWPEGRHSTKTLGFDTASRIATDANETRVRRLAALLNLRDGVLTAVETLKEIAGGGGKLGNTAEEILLGLRLSCANPADLEFRFTTVESIAPIAQGARVGSDTHRHRMMRELEREATFALSSVFQAGLLGGSENVGDRVRSILTSIGEDLGL